MYIVFYNVIKDKGREKVRESCISDISLERRLARVLRILKEISFELKSSTVLIMRKKSIFFTITIHLSYMRYVSDIIICIIFDRSSSR